MKLTLFFVLALALSAMSLSTHEQFRAWMKEHNKKYSDATEYSRRLENFRTTLERIDRQSQQNKLAKFSLNKFSDLSEEEFARYYKMKKMPADALAVSCLAKGVTAELNYNVSDLPTSFDWRDKGAVTPIKDQGQCGSCWTFSTTGNIEGQYFLKTGKLVSFSEQLLVDCSQGCCFLPGYGNVCNQGCNGGWQWNAFFDVVNWGGIQTEDSYPYTSGGGASGACQKNNSILMAKITNYTCISTGGGAPANEDQMAAYIQQKGPISIALNAGYLQDYSSGVVDPWFPSQECDPTQLDHAVLIVGWGVDSGVFGNTPYWLVKNSWSDSWGEKGYFRIYRGSNVCGVANAVSSAFF
jgi:cathepsin F